MHLYEEIEAWLMEEIHTGRLQPGDKIPREIELAAQFHTSRPTVRQALANLTAAGVIVRTKRKGSFVCEPKLLQEYTRFISSYRKEMQEKGLHPRTLVLEYKKLRPRAEIAEILDLSPSQKAMKLSRLRFLEEPHPDRPVLFTTVYIPAPLFPNVEGSHFETESLYDTLEKHGVSIRHVRREIEIRFADARVSNLLRVKAGTPLFFISSVGYAEDGRPVEYSESYYPSESSKFLVEIDREIKA